MISEKFEEISTEILDNDILKNLETIKDNRVLINRNLLVKYEQFSSFNTKNLKFKEGNLETKEDIDQRVKRYNELNDRLKKFTKATKRQFKVLDEHCKSHRGVISSDYLGCLNKFMEKDLSVPDVNESLKKDEDLFRQHASNIENLSKLMETAKEHKIEEATLSSAKGVNESTKFLCETINDVDCLNESSTMYNCLSRGSPNVAFNEEIKDLTDKFYNQ